VGVDGAPTPVLKVRASPLAHLNDLIDHRTLAATFTPAAK